MEFSPEKQKKLGLWIIGLVAACIIIFLGIQNIDIVAGAVSWCLSLISPLLIGLALAMILNVPMSFIEVKLFPKAKNRFAHKLRRPLAYVISLAVIIGILVGVFWLVIPEFFGAIKILAESAIDIVVKLSSMSEAEISALPMGKYLLEINWDQILNDLQNWLKNQSGEIVGTAIGTISSMINGIFDFFIAFVFSIYILFSKEKLKTQACRLIRVWLPEKTGQWWIYAFSVASYNFRNFIAGQSLEAVILGGLCMLGMTILDIPYAVMVGVLVGITALIPVVGAFIGAGVGAFMILTISPVKALIFVVFLVVLQQLEGNIIYPKVMGSRINLPGMWILAAVTIGGGIAGPVGMLLSVPVTGTLYVLFKDATAYKELQRFPTPEPDDEQS